MRQLLLCMIVLGVVSTSTLAQINTDRPDQTESSSVVPDGALQLESGILIIHQGERPESRQWLLPTNLFRYGLSDRIELRFLSQYEVHTTNGRTITGMSDPHIGTKVQLQRDTNKNTEIALLSHLVIPTGSTYLTANEVGTTNKLSISHSVNDNVGIGYNIGYDNFGSGNGDLTYSLALGVGINDQVGVYMEVYGRVTELEVPETSFDGGLTYRPGPDVQLDLSFGTGLDHRMNYLSLGCSWLMQKEDAD